MEKQIISNKEELYKIADELKKARSVYIFAHIIPDGDAMGSSAALCGAMRSLGKESFIIMEDDYPDNLSFLDNDFCVWTGEGYNLPSPDLALALDCSDPSRFPNRKHIFESAKVTACIDHHISTGEYAKYNYIDEYAAATCELAYLLLHDVMKLSLDKQQAEAIYTGILTDTGNFQYSNTTADTHLIAADLYKSGIDAYAINIMIHQNERIEKVRLHSKVLSEMKIFYDGRAALATCTLDLLKEFGADDTETDGINAAMRDIKGVEVAIFLRERPNGMIKCGMRSKQKVNVALIAKKFGGGGHVRAAGCTLESSLDEAISALTEEVIKVLNETDFSDE